MSTMAAETSKRRRARRRYDDEFKAQAVRLVLDEAHKTTGERDATFALALDDAELAIRKRLFFTATPRHINIRGERDRDDDFTVVSMDDPAVYGPRAHTLSFADAVAQDLICDYRVVVSVVDPAEVTAFALQHGITLIEGEVTVSMCNSSRGRKGLHFRSGICEYVRPYPYGTSFSRLNHALRT